MVATDAAAAGYLLGGEWKKRPVAQLRLRSIFVWGYYGARDRHDRLMCKNTMVPIMEQDYIHLFGYGFFHIRTFSYLGYSQDYLPFLVLSYTTAPNI